MLGRMEIVPDKGWSWCILIAGCLANLLVDGVIFSFGVFKLELTEAFKEDISIITWIGSVLGGCQLVTGITNFICFV